MFFSRPFATGMLFCLCLIYAAESVGQTDVHMLPATMWAKIASRLDSPKDYAYLTRTSRTQHQTLRDPQSLGMLYADLYHVYAPLRIIESRMPDALRLETLKSVLRMSPRPLDLNSAFMAACLHRQWQIIEFLLAFRQSKTYNRRGYELDINYANGKALFVLSGSGGETPPDVIESMLEAGASFRLRYDGGAKTVAAHYGRLDILKLFERYGMDVNELGNYPFRAAVRHQHMDILQWILGHKEFRVDFVSQGMVEAVDKGWFQGTRLLLEHEADVHFSDDAALAKAVNSRRPDLVALLISNGANIEAGHHYALRCAIKHNDHQTAEILLATGAQTNFGLMAQHGNGLMTYNPITLACFERNIIMVNLLCKYGANVNVDQGEALKHAASLGDVELMNALLVNGLDLTLEYPVANHDVSIGETAMLTAIRREQDLFASELFARLPYRLRRTYFLSRAAEHGTADMVAYLAIVEPEIYTQTVLDEALLNMLCDGRRNAANLKVLILLGADAHQNNEEPFYRARFQCPNFDLVTVLREHGAGSDSHFLRKAFRHAVVSHNVVVLGRVSSFLKFDDHASFGTMGHPVTDVLALWKFSREVIEGLQAMMAEGWDLRDQDDFAFRFEAQTLGRMEVLEFFLNHGADIHVKHDEPLRMAVFQGNIDAVQVLLNYGANVDVLRNFTPFLVQDNAVSIRMLDLLGRHGVHVRDNFFDLSDLNRVELK